MAIGTSGNKAACDRNHRVIVNATVKAGHPLGIIQKRTQGILQEAHFETRPVLVVPHVEANLAILVDPEWSVSASRDPKAKAVSVGTLGINSYIKVTI